MPLSPDITSAALEVRDNTLKVSVRFASGTFNADTTEVFLALDADENTATGFAGITGWGETAADASSLGVDYIMYLSKRGTQVYRYANGQWGAVSGTIAVTTVSDGLDATTALSTIGDDGRVAFKLGSAAYVSAAGTTSLLDYAPDPGLAVGRTR